jgi:hypothetical protein
MLAARKALQRIEEHRRALLRAGRDLGDAADLVQRIRAFDAAQCAEPVDLLDEPAKVFVLGH